jgi:hypothetical protein
MLHDAIEAQQPKWGTVTGRVVFEGDLDHPVLKPFVDDITIYQRQTNRASMRGEKPVKLGSIPNEQLLIDPKTRGIRNCYVYLRKKPDRIHPSLAAVPKEHAELAHAGWRFTPGNQVIRVGQSVQLINRDAKDVANFSLRTSFLNEAISVLLPVNRSHLWTPQQAEPIPLQFINILSSAALSARAHVLVTNHPYATITAEDGSFLLDRVPAGEHELRIWHETIGYVARKLRVEVPSDGEAKLETRSITVQQLSISKPPVDLLLRDLRRAESAIRNLSVTTDYVKRHKLQAAGKEPVRTRFLTKATVDRAGRTWTECVGEEVHLTADGKYVGIRRGKWRSAFDGEVVQQMEALGEADFRDAATVGMLTWRGLDPRELTTHFLQKPVHEMLRDHGVESLKWMGQNGRWIAVETLSVGTEQERKYRFWIDQERKTIVRRCLLIRSSSDAKWRDHVCLESSHHNEVEPGVWLPMITKYKSVDVSYTGTSRDWRVNQTLPDGTFSLVPPQ